MAASLINGCVKKAVNRFYVQTGRYSSSLYLALKHNKWKLGRWQDWHAQVV